MLGGCSNGSENTKETADSTKKEEKKIETAYWSSIDFYNLQGEAMAFEPEKITALKFTPNLNPDEIDLLKINSDQTFENYSVTSFNKSADISGTITEDDDFFALSYTVYKQINASSPNEVITKENQTNSFKYFIKNNYLYAFGSVEKEGNNNAFTVVKRYEKTTSKSAADLIKKVEEYTFK